MNAIDKQHAWEALVTHLRASNVMPSDAVIREVGGERLAVDCVISELIIAHATVKKLQGIGYDEVKSTRELFTDDDIAILRILVSTAVWIRSEQLAHPDCVIRIRGWDHGPAVEIDTHNLHLQNLRSEFQAGQVLYTKLQQYISDHAIPDPEWRK